MTFKTHEEAEKYFYEHFDCLSDDVDKEEARIMNWIESNNITIEENA